MKQLDVDMNPPANTMTFSPDLTHVTFDLDHVTFDLDPYDPWPWRLPARQSNETWNHTFGLVNLTFKANLRPWPTWPLKLTYVTIDPKDYL